MVKALMLTTHYLVRGEGGKYHAGKNLFTELSFDIEPNRLAVITGESGRGKTTLLNILAGLTKPYDGSVEGDYKTYYAPCAKVLLEALTVRENILLATGMTEQSLASDLTHLFCLERGLYDKAILDEHPSELSEGEYKRVLIARAFHMEKRDREFKGDKVVILDEPTANLDDETARAVIRSITHLYMKDGCAIVVATHDDRLIEKADKVIRL